MLQGRVESIVAVVDVSRSTQFSVGHVLEENVDDLFRLMKAELVQSEKNTASARRQSPGHQGNQKTPSFAYVILKQLIAPTTNEELPKINEELPIQGGTTDVGLHTGCVLRNTSFPLVLSCLRTMLVFNGERNDEPSTSVLFCTFRIISKT
jgi:hypothetical protein